MTIAKQHRARAKRRCDTCRADIEKGALYWRISLPPHTEPLYAPGWHHLSTCGRYTHECERYWEIDSRIAAKDHTLVEINS